MIQKKGVGFIKTPRLPTCKHILTKKYYNDLSYYIYCFLSFDSERTLCFTRKDLKSTPFAESFTEIAIEQKATGKNLVGTDELVNYILVEDDEVENPVFSLYKSGQSIGKLVPSYSYYNGYHGHENLSKKIGGMINGLNLKSKAMFGNE